MTLDVSFLATHFIALDIFTSQMRCFKVVSSHGLAHSLINGYTVVSLDPLQKAGFLPFVDPLKTHGCLG
jgi:hypothetical protein